MRKLNGNSPRYSPFRELKSIGSEFEIRPPRSFSSLKSERKVNISSVLNAVVYFQLSWSATGSPPLFMFYCSAQELLRSAHFCDFGFVSDNHRTRKVSRLWNPDINPYKILNNCAFAVITKLFGFILFGFSDRSSMYFVGENYAERTSCVCPPYHQERQ